MAKGRLSEGQARSSAPPPTADLRTEALLRKRLAVLAGVSDNLPAFAQNTFAQSDIESFHAMAVLRSRRFRLPANVRLWLLADISGGCDLRPLYPRKRT